MKEEFVKESKILETTEEERVLELFKNIKQVKKNLETSYENMNHAQGDLIDYYIYKIKSEEAKYAYLLKQIKQIQPEENKL